MQRPRRAQVRGERHPPDQIVGDDENERLPRPAVRQGEVEQADGPVTRHVLAPVAKKLFHRHYVGLAITEDELRDSDLDWTVIRPPRLLHHRLRRRYRAAVDINVRGGMFVARADVARHMPAVVDDPSTFAHTVGIAY
ncbi:NAD(P)H-binding protein [Couchioplanes caeruleus]|uniref:NAD(P)H-binding protein n=1 Tax=Couchioplanes caeruleus TaxID=56438 RepID=UPI001B803443